MAVNQANDLSLSTLKANSDTNSTSSLICFEHTWTIEHIDKLANESIRGFPHMHSSLFTAPVDKITTEDKQPVQFQLGFYPKGLTVETQDSVAIFLAMKNHTDLTALFTFSFVKTNDEKHLVTSIFKKFETGKTMSWGINDFSKDELYDPANNFVLAGKLVLHCEINIITTELAQPDLSDQLQDKHSQPELLNQSFGKLLESGNQSDVTLVMVDDGREELRAHKSILVARSKVFAGMFSFEMAESTSNRVEIQGVKVKVFQQVLQHIYTGRVQGSLDGTAQDLLICADKYQLDSLKATCEEYLCSQITAKSESDLFRLAYINDATKLKNAVLDFKRKALIRTFGEDPEMVAQKLLAGSYIDELDLD